MKSSTPNIVPFGDWYALITESGDAFSNLESVRLQYAAGNIDKGYSVSYLPCTEYKALRTVTGFHRHEF